MTAEGTVTNRILPLPAPRIPMIVGIAALVVCALYGLYSPASFFRAYLIAFLMWVGVSLGALAIVEIGRLTGGHWAAQLRPVLGPAARAMPLLLVLFLPLLLGLYWVFPWANPGTVADDAELRQKTVIWLNVPFFIVRAIFYFAVWIGFAYVVTPPRQAGSPPLTFAEKRRLGIVSALGLGFFGLTVTFASIDWAMSLEPEPRWFSTIYGVMWAVGMILSAFSFGVAYVCAFNPDADKQVLRDLGNLLMAFTLVWVYMAFSQYLLIWSGNLREEIPWYIRRSQGVWSGIAFLLTLFQFAVPFAFLLSGHVKTNPRSLMGVALLVFFMRFVDIFWLTAPAFPNYGDLFFLQPLAFVGMGGLWIAAFLWLKPSTVPDVVSVAEPAGELAHE